MNSDDLHWFMTIAVDDKDSKLLLYSTFASSDKSFDVPGVSAPDQIYGTEFDKKTGARIFHGTFSKDGIRLKGTEYSATKYGDKRFNGSYDKQGRQINGYLSFMDYKGDIKNNLPNGKGCIAFDEYALEGNWKDGKFILDNDTKLYKYGGGYYDPKDYAIKCLDSRKGIISIDFRISGDIFERVVIDTIAGLENKKSAIVYKTYLKVLKYKDKNIKHGVASNNLSHDGKYMYIYE